MQYHDKNVASTVSSAEIGKVDLAPPTLYVAVTVGQKSICQMTIWRKKSMGRVLAWAFYGRTQIFVVLVLLHTLDTLKYSWEKSAVGLILILPVIG